MHQKKRVNRFTQFAYRTREELERPRAEVQTVLSLRAKYASLLIAGGIFGDTTVVSEVIADVVKRMTDHDRRHEALNAIFTRAKDAGVEIRVPAKDCDDINEGDWGDEVMYHLMLQWGDAGFMLGLAVGMQLGPDAFTGGAR